MYHMLSLESALHGYRSFFGDDLVSFAQPEGFVAMSVYR